MGLVVLLVSGTSAIAGTAASAARRNAWATEVRRVVPPGFIEAIGHPRSLAAREATIDPDEPVIGVSIGGEHRAYAVYLLNAHEVVNDTLAGEPIVVVWCPLANLAAVYSRGRGAGGPHVFEASGNLMKSTVVLIDYETDSLWAALSGEALVGPAAGERLVRIPSAQKVPWRTWVDMHPDTTLAMHQGSQSPGFDSYADYHQSRHRIGLDVLRPVDARLPAKAMVVGIDRDGEQRAYPFSVFGRRKTLMTTFGGLPILIYRDEATELTAVYSRMVRDAGGSERKLRFGVLPTVASPHGTADTVADLTTGTVWDLRAGAAVAGELQGARLTPVPFANVYWFVWGAHYPRARLYWNGRPPAAAPR